MKSYYLFIFIKDVSKLVRKAEVYFLTARGIRRRKTIGI